MRTRVPDQMDPPPILRNLAIPGACRRNPRQRRRLHVFEVISAQDADHAGMPAATNARSFVLLRCLGLLAGVVAQA